MNNLLWICASVGGFLLYAVTMFTLACIFIYLTDGDFVDGDFPSTLQAVAALFIIVFYMEQFFDKSEVSK